MISLIYESLRYLLPYYASVSYTHLIFTADASLINFTAPMLRIYLGGLFLFGIQIACQMTFTSLGKAVNSIVVAVVRKFVLLLPLIYLSLIHISSSPEYLIFHRPDNSFFHPDLAALHRYVLL